MNKPKVSVIVPCYNMGLYIEQTVDSILSQTYDNIELVIVDDGSTDPSTIEVLKKLEATDVRVIYQKNTGLSGARNKGIQETSGEFIVCLDSDDAVEEAYIEELLGVFSRDERGSLGIVTSWIQCFGNSNEIWKPIEYDPVALMIKNIPSVASMYRRECWEKAGGYNSNMKGGYEDWNFWIGIVKNGYTWKVVEKPLFLYRRRANSMVAGSIKMHEELYKRIVDNNIDFFEKNWYELTLRYCQKVNFLENQLESRNSLFFKILTKPKLLLNPKNYLKGIKRLLK